METVESHAREGALDAATEQRLALAGEPVKGWSRLGEFKTGQKKRQTQAGSAADAVSGGMLEFSQKTLGLCP